jgi:hypothetical protein
VAPEVKATAASDPEFQGDCAMMHEKAVMNDTLLRDILAAINVRAREFQAARDDPANARQHRLAENAAARRVSGLHVRAAHAFGAVNGWRFSTRYNFTPDHLGRAHNNYGHAYRGWRDHPLYYKAPRSDGKRGWINVAIVGQPYGLTTGTCGDIENLVVTDGLVLHTPPANPRASIWYPSATLFLVLTLPNIAIRWLPEQTVAHNELAPSHQTRVDDFEQFARISPTTERSGSHRS